MKYIYCIGSEDNVVSKEEAAEHFSKKCCEVFGLREVQDKDKAVRKK